MQVLNFRGNEVHVRRFPYRRSIGLTLLVSGRIRVSAPKTTPMAAIELFLSKNQDWIDTHLSRYSELRAAHPPKRYIEGEEFPLLGERAQLKYVAAKVSRTRCEVRDRQIVVAIPSTEWASFDPQSAHPEMASVVSDCYSKLGRMVITRRLEMFSEQMGVKPSSVRFGSQKTRWGSCSARRRISLNWRLIFAPIEIIDYVVIHELAHLRFYNHSAAFWNFVSEHCAGYREYRQWLRDHQFDADFLAKSSELHT